MNKKKWFIIGAAAVIILGFIGYAFSGGGKESVTSDIFEVKKEDLKEIISEVGKVVPVKELNLNFPLAGRIAKLLVKEGQTVKKGQLLVKLDTSKIQAQLAQAQSQVAEAQARLNKAYAGASVEDVKISETGVANAENALEKVKIAAEKDIETNKMSIDAAETAYNKAEKYLADLQIDADQDLRQSYEDALNTLRDASTKIDKALNTIDYVQERYFTYSSQLDRDVQFNKDAANNSYIVLKPYIQNADISDFTSIDTALSKTSEYLDKLADILTHLRESMEDKGLVNKPTVTEKGYVDTDRTSIDTAISSITTVSQAIDAAKSTNNINISTAEADLKSASTALEKAKSALSSVEAGWDSKITDAEGAVELTKDQLTLKKAGPTKEDIALYKAQVSQAMSYADLIRQDLNDSSIYAPLNGIITKVDGDAGELAGLAKPVISMISIERYQIETFISELDVARIKVSNPVEVTFDALGQDKLFGATVIEIDPYETTTDEDIYYKVTIGLDQYDEAIRSGMTANIEIKTAEKKGVLVVPSRFIGEEDNKKYVKIQKGGEDMKNFDLAEVKVGITGTDMTEVTEGLAEGQKIISYY